MEKTTRYKVIVSDRARQMLTNHIRFLAERVLMPEQYPFLDTERYM